MNSCFKKFVGFKIIMSDGLDRLVALKKWCNFSNSVKITQNNVFFSYFIKLYEYWDNFQYSYETKKSFVENIMRLMFEEVKMSDRHTSDGQIYSFLQQFFKTEIIRSN